MIYKEKKEIQRKKFLQPVANPIRDVCVPPIQGRGGGGEDETAIHPRRKCKRNAGENQSCTKRRGGAEKLGEPFRIFGPYVREIVMSVNVQRAPYLCCYRARSLSFIKKLLG